MIHLDLVAGQPEMSWGEFESAVKILQDGWSAGAFPSDKRREDNPHKDKWRAILWDSGFKWARVEG